MARMISRMSIWRQRFAVFRRHLAVLQGFWEVSVFYAQRERCVRLACWQFGAMMKAD